MRKVRVGMIKAVPVKWSKRKNWNTLDRLILEAARQGAEVVITPECFLDGYVIHEESCTPERVRRVAERGEKGTYVRRLRALAAEIGLYLVAGLTDTPDRRIFYNAAYLFAPDARVAGKYYKIHVASGYTPGDVLPVFDTQFGRVGIVICADRRWPETIRVLAIKGAEAILMPTYGMWHEANECWMRTRGYENGVYICFTHPNVALIVNPKGAVEAKLTGNVEGVLVHDLDLDAVSRTHLEERRPDMYDALTAPLPPRKPTGQGCM